MHRGPEPYRTYEVTKRSITALRPTANPWSDELQIVQAPSYPRLSSTVPEVFSIPQDQQKDLSRETRTHKLGKDALEITNLFVHHPELRTSDPVFRDLPRR